MKSRVHPKYKTSYHVANWPDVCQGSTSVRSTWKIVQSTFFAQSAPVAYDAPSSGSSMMHSGTKKTGCECDYVCS